MDKSLQLIIGISIKTGQKLAEVGIKTAEGLLKEGTTVKKRETLAKKLGIDKAHINSWVKQADLMRVEGISAGDADLLTKVGIRNVEDLANANPEILTKMLSVYNNNYPEAVKRSVAINELEYWQGSAKNLKKIISPDPNEDILDFLMADQKTDSPENTPKPPTYKSTTDIYFEDMTDIIANLGKGIAQAQHALDLTAAKTQEEINRDPELRSTGLMATWYVIPEATFNLKMDYQVTFEEERQEESKGLGLPTKKILMSPINAKYQNIFKMNEALQSELNLKFVPSPPPVAMSQVRFAPKLIGKPLAEAKEIIKKENLVLTTVTNSTQGPEGAVADQVLEQSIAAGDEIRFNDKISLTVFKQS